MNTYSYTITKTNNGIKLYILQVNCTLLAAFNVYSNVNDLLKAVTKLLTELPYLKYDYSHENDGNKLIDYYINSEDKIYFSKINNHQMFLNFSDLL